MSIRYFRDLRYRTYKGSNVKGPKTFKTEESAKAYADKNGIKKYSLKNLKSPESSAKKLLIVQA